MPVKKGKVRKTAKSKSTKRGTKSRRSTTGRTYLDRIKTLL